MKHSSVQILVKWVAKENQLDKVLSLLQEVTPLSKAESGNLVYQAYQSTIDSNTIFLVEEYADLEALEAHKKSPHYLQIVLAQIVPLLESREVHIVQSI